MSSDLPYADLLEKNYHLGSSIVNDQYRVALLSNIVINQLSDFLEFQLRTHGLPAVVKVGAYDNILQDSLKYSSSRLVVVFWETCNLIKDFHHTVECLDSTYLNKLFDDVTLKLDLFFRGIDKTHLVLFNKFSSTLFDYSVADQSKLRRLSDRLNLYLKKSIPNNVCLVDIDNIYAAIGVNNAVDWRFFYSAKALYSIQFFSAYAEYVLPVVLSREGASKKALIFDCDNTLWGGVLSEDGHHEIKMNDNSATGRIYREIQSLAVALSKSGVLIGLCSKNNSSDIDNVLSEHPDMLLRTEHLSAKRANWLDKATNLRGIAEELNIDLNSIVFVDDSEFEVNWIREQCPEVVVLQVPKELHLYPQMIRTSFKLFLNSGLTREDRSRVKMYQVQAQRVSAKNRFTDLASYLRYLQMKISLVVDDKPSVPRLAQMTQKTNQFNLSVKRYTEQTILSFMDDPHSHVFSFSVIDRYGDNGITGLCIITTDTKTHEAILDTFLMSCRIIGREIENAVFDYLADWLKDVGVRTLEATYVNTRKNLMVVDFLTKAGFTCSITGATESAYRIDLGLRNRSDIDFIDVIPSP